MILQAVTETRRQHRSGKRYLNVIVLPQSNESEDECSTDGEEIVQYPSLSSESSESEEEEQDDVMQFIKINNPAIKRNT
ncbi:hypothetical protein Ciccas_008103, partial [Cichlidogyrus casuarinus]